jgi:hypothetical protein
VSHCFGTVTVVRRHTVCNEEVLVSDVHEADKSTDLRVAGGKRLSKDPSVALTHLIDMTKQSDFPPFWVPYNAHLWLPPSVRSNREVATAVITNDSFKMGFIELRYKDGTVVSLKTQDLHTGCAVMPGEITQKWVLCDVGEKDLRGNVHKKGG